MFIDSVLESAPITQSKITFWRYHHRYDWCFHEEENTVSILPKETSDISWTAGVYIRDFTISKYLKDFGIKKILDVGADTGCFMAFCRMHWIESVGIDADRDAVEHINAKWVNKAYHYWFEDLVNLSKLGNEYDCLVCMNILHSPRFEEEIKWKFISYIENNYKYSILTLKSSDVNKLENLELVYGFSILKFSGYRFIKPFQIKYSATIQFFLRIFWLNALTDYISIQALYKSKIIH